MIHIRHESKTRISLLTISLLEQRHEKANTMERKNTDKKNSIKQKKTARNFNTPLRIYNKPKHFDFIV